MPILRKQCEIFPESLLDLPTASAPWEVAHLRSRREKTVARLLLDENKPFYLPQIQQTQKRGGRTVTSHLPLFPGYIFLRRVDGLERTLWRSGVVANLIEVMDQAQLTADLLQLRKLQASGAILAPCPDLIPGDGIEIQEGAFSGYTGVVVEERGQLRLLVSVAMLRKSVAIEFPRDVMARAKGGDLRRTRQGARASARKLNRRDT